MKTAALLWLAISGASSLWFLWLCAREERAQANAALRQGRITMTHGGVVQHRHPTECADCGDTFRNLDGSCWTCSGRRRQPRAIHREAAA